MNKKILDKINPLHYQGSIETIDCIQSQLNDDEFKGYLRGSCMKYLCRAGKKSLTGADEATVALEDYCKAHWYIERLINYLESKNKKKGS